MGSCTGRCFLITLCILQFIATVERLAFDFLGYMWAPIIGNFLQLVFVIIGFFGAFQYRPKIIIVYAVWCLIWLGWNVFVICFYMEAGILQKTDPILDIGTGHKSWWFEKGIGCQVIGNSSNLESSPDRPLDDSDIKGCLLDYDIVEIIHAGVQCLLALLGFCVSCYVIYVFTEEDDSSQPVHDELEYIKMRYRSPARSSFRDQKTYETLTTQLGSTYSSADRGLEGHTGTYSDDSTDRPPGANPRSTEPARKYFYKEPPPNIQSQWSQPGVQPVVVSPGIPGSLSQTQQYEALQRRQGSRDDGYNTGDLPLPPPPPQQLSYDIGGQPPGVTVI